MPRDGKRAGLGRPPKVFVGPREATRFELADRLTEMPGGPEGQRGRFIVALAETATVQMLLPSLPGQLR